MSRTAFPAALLALGVASQIPAFAQYESCHSASPTLDPPAYDEADCTGDATICGIGNDPIQKIPVGDGFLYVGFSTITNAAGTTRTNNVTMWVLELACDQSADVLIFGTGYGCRNTHEYDPVDDVATVDTIIRDCIGLSGTVEVAIVVPHAHGDHINPEFYHELMAVAGPDNYTLDKIYVHADDLGGTKSLAAVSGCSGSVFTTAEKNAMTGIFQTIGTGGDMCNGTPENDCESAWNASGVKSFHTTLGKTWFRGRDGHTRGSVDMVIDYLGDDTERYLVYGSATPCVVVGNNCYTDPSTGTKRTPTCALSGVQWAIAAHGDIALLSAPPSTCP